MFRSLSIAVLALAASPLSAQGHYTARPVVAHAKSTIVTRSTVWRCAGGTCSAAKGGSRDAIMCELLVREVGRVERFAAADAAFDAEALERCNARARD